MDIVERWREQECEDLLALQEDFERGEFEIMEEQQTRTEVQPTSKRRKLAHCFFYYHLECGDWRDASEYEEVNLSDCHPDTVCCGCWGNIHEPKKQ